MTKNLMCNRNLTTSYTKLPFIFKPNQSYEIMSLAMGWLAVNINCTAIYINVYTMYFECVIVLCSTVNYI